MTVINVAPSVYYEAATICSAAAVAFFEAVTTQFGELARHTTDMAGSIGDGKVWAGSYDQQTTETYLLFESLIGAIDNYSDILIEAGYNYALADYDGNGPAPQRPATPQPALTVCPVMPPSAGGPGNGLVDDGLDLAAQIGVPIPDGDADKLAKAAGCWNTLATGQATANLPAELERAAVLFQEVTAPDVSFIDEDLRELKSSAEDLLTTFADLATACRDQEAAHRKLRADLAAVLTEFAEDIGKEILVTVALSVAASVVGFGMGSAVVAAIRAGKFATKVKHYVDRLRKVMDTVKLKTAVTLQKSVPSSRQKLQRIIDLVKQRGSVVKNPLGPGVKTVQETPLVTNPKQIEAKFKHAEDFGIATPRGKEGFRRFDDAVKNHVDDPATLHIDGTYRGNPAILNYNPNTGLVVVQSPSGEFVSGWKLSRQQAQNVLEQGKLGGG